MPRKSARDRSIVPPKPQELRVVGRQLKYREIEAEVRKLVQTLPVGAKMPTERELAQSYDCSVLTIRRGLQVLVDEGAINRRMGSGTFVAQHSGKLVQSEKSLGVLVFENSGPYAYRLLQGLAHAALRQSIQPVSVWIRDFGLEARAQVDSLRREGCKAFTIPWFPPEKAEEVSAFIKECGIPLSLPQPVPGFEHYCFEPPQLFGKHTVKMTELLCRYFQLLGNQQIAFIGPDAPNDAILQQQLATYISTVSRVGKPAICRLVAESAQAMDEVAKQWAEAYQGTLAVVSYDDEHALRLITAMHKLGKSAPKDFRVVGYNNTEASRFSDPPLSTVVQNFDYVANGLINTATALSNGEHQHSAEMPTSLLVVRSTCGGGDALDEKIRSQLNGLTFDVSARKT